MNIGHQTLLDYEEHWPTNVGAWFPAERVVMHGKDVFTELKDLSWMAYHLFGITGRIPNEKQVRLFEAIWMLTTSYPEPRLWNNRIASLAGTTRSTAALGIGAATAVSEAVVYGNRVNMRAIDFWLRIGPQLEQGADLKELIVAEMKQYRGIPGYGRPLTRHDERIKPMMELAEKLGFADGRYVKLAFEVEEILIESRYRMYMNITALDAAFAADQGFSRHEYHRYMILTFSAGMFPCYADAINKPEGAFFPLRCDRIQYKGKAPRRKWKK